MKRFLVCAVAVMLLAGGAYAQNPAKVWLQAPDGSNKVCVAPSETAVVELWLEIYTGFELINMDANVLGAPAGGTPAETANFDVYGYNDQSPFSNPDMAMSRASDPVPGADMDSYSIVWSDENYPLHVGMGAGAGLYKIDEIIVHGVTQEVIDCPETPDKTTCSWMSFARFAQAPGGFKIFTSYGYGPYTSQVALDLGTGAFGAPMFVCVTPEPASLALLALGGLVAIRRR